MPFRPRAGSCTDASQIVSMHNSFRARHSAPAMSWDSNLERDATAWAQRLASQGCGLVHGGANGAGQNLYASYVSG